MPILANPRHELLAYGIAQGLSQRAAARSADYKEGGSFVRKKVNSAAFKERVEEIRPTIGWGDTRNLSPVINELALAAKAAVKKSTDKELVAWLKAAGDLLKIVADLKQRLPPDPEPEEPEVAAPMTSEEWARKFKPGA